MEYENSLKFKNPELSAQWHPSHNGKLTPEDVTTGSSKKVWWTCKKGHEWLASIKHRSHGCGCPYCSGNKVIPGETDLATVNPTLAREWHSTKNGDLIPTKVMANSGKKVWWECTKGHEWQATIANRNYGKDCPYCSGRKAILNETDLVTINPVLAKQWHPVKNGKLKPTMVAAGSNKKVWWKCSEGHEWQAIIYNRSNGYGCPFCLGKKVILGETDLATVNPTLAREWHPTKNNELNPTMVTSGSKKKAWWLCSEGHEWEAVVHSRNRGSGCPYCSGNQAIPGKTDLHTVNPKLAKEWNYEINSSLDPTELKANSDKKVWWRCPEGHEWKSRIANRNRGDGCPFCSGRLPIVGLTDLATANATLSEEWHPTKNEGLNPTMVTASSHKKVWWKCQHGHEWESSIASRNNKRGCPYCSGKLPIQGATDLATVNSTLASEWHPTKNGNLKPNMITEASGKKVWWQCSKGHEWQSTIYNRSNGYGCPFCSGKKVLLGETDLATVNPTLAREWHSTKNADLKPTNVTANSGKKIWWKCSKGHEWQARISSRNSGSGCPICINKKGPTKKSIS